MLLETKTKVLDLLDKNLIIVRDTDWEVLGLLWRDKEWYFVYYMEHCNITKSEAKALLDKAAWITSIPVVDEKIYEQNKDKLKEEEAKVQEIIDDLELDENL